MVHYPHLNVENLRKTLDAGVVTPRWSYVMGLFGASEPLAFWWLQKSAQAERDKDTSSVFYLEYPEGEGVFDYWHRWVLICRKRNIATLEAQIRDEALNGVEVPVIENGKVCLKENPEFIGISDDDMRAMHDPLTGESLNLNPVRDRILWNADGTPQVLTRREMMPAALRSRILAGLIPGTFGDHSTVDIRSQNVVRIIGDVQPAAPPVALPAPEAERPDIVELKERARALALNGPMVGKPTAPVHVFGRVPGDQPDDKPLTKPTIAPVDPPRQYQAEPITERKPKPYDRHPPPDRVNGRRVC